MLCKASSALGRLRYECTLFLPSRLEVFRIASHGEYIRYARACAGESARRREKERALAAGTGPFSLAGYCYVCKRRTRFTVTFDHAYEIDGVLTPNWREQLYCRGCGMSARHRSVIHLFETECRPGPDETIYISEQTTPLYHWLRRAYPLLVGSEYLGDACPRGKETAGGIRNEDLTDLSFPDGSFDRIILLDILEHIPGYPRALGECLRCLRPGGSLFITVPFEKESAKTIVRARVKVSGEIEHLLPPEYHSDPLRDAGTCLSYYIFGWDLLDRLRDAGYAHATALLFWSDAFGYIGRHQLVIVAVAPGTARHDGGKPRP